MKCIVLFVALSAVCAVYSVPLPQHGMFFYQQAGVPQYRQPAVHRMYLQYQQPYRAQRRSASVPNSGISAYVAGNQVAASGSFLKGLFMRALTKKLQPFQFLLQKQIQFNTPPPSTTSTPPDDADLAPLADEQPELLADELPVNDEGAVSIAEAYPAESEADEPQQDAEPEFEAPAQSPKVPKELAPPAAAEEAPVAAAAPLLPVAPQKKNKVTVTLDDDDDSAQDDEPVAVYQKGGRRPANGGGASSPINTFFPINFGNTNGGAIAVANAYNAGGKGGARSHAIAYGTPAGKNKRRQVTAAAAQ